MKNILIGVLSLGLMIGFGTVGAEAFSNNTTREIPNIQQNSFTESKSDFKVLNQQTNQFETLDDSNYRNTNPNYGQGCCIAPNQFR